MKTFTNCMCVAKDRKANSLIRNVSIALIALLLVFCGSCIFVSQAHAEGSADLTSNGGYRPYTENYGQEIAGVHRQSVMKVYLKAGETYYLGSSVSTSVLVKTHEPDSPYLFNNSVMGTDFDENQLLFINTADIRVCSPSWNTTTNPLGTPYANGVRDSSVTLIDIPDAASASTVGYIADRTQETSGPAARTSGGYVCSSTNTITPISGVDASVKTSANTFTASETGVYTIIFYSPSFGVSNPKLVGADSSFWDQKDSTVAAWDISVYSDDTLKTGRVFTDALYLNMGSNTGHSTLESIVYPVTSDGYIYEMDFNGMDPFGFRFSCNNRGLLDTTYTSSVTSLYHSVKSDDNQLSDLTDHYVGLSSLSTSPLDKSYWIFYNAPDADTLTALGIPTNLDDDGADVDNGTITGFKFTGNGDSTENEGYTGLGGTFSFYAGDVNATSYQIELKFGDNNFVTLSNALVKNATNTIEWDGRDANGDIVPAGVYDTDTSNPSNITLVLKGGEAHFPLIDVENNPNGIILTRLNGGGTDEEKATVYYNNSARNAGDTTDPWTLEKNWVVADEVDAAEHGIVSTQQAALKYANSAGDETVLDVWAYYDVPVNLGKYSFTLVELTPTAQAVPSITKGFTTSSERPINKKFTFDLSASTSNPAGAVLPARTTASITDAGTSVTPFRNITFTKAGVFTFYIAEESGGDTGYTYDPHVFVYTVATDVDPLTGSLVVTSTSLKVKDDAATPDTSAVAVGRIDFENAYTPEAVTIDGIDVSKAVTPADHPDEEFTYKLVGEATNPVDGVSGLNGSYSTSQTGTVDNPAVFSNPFAEGADGIAFSKPGTYTFKCFEEPGTVTGWDYDENYYVWTVVVEDNDGNLKVTDNTLIDADDVAIDDNTAAFTNTYEQPSETYVIPGIEKQVTGDTPSDETYTFTLSAGETTPQAPMPDTTSVDVTGDGTASFGSITYHETGVYDYVITETKGSIPGYTYDPAVYNLEVTVELIDGDLVSTGIVTEDGEEVASILFTNIYEPASADCASPDVEKTLDGTPPSAGTFDFTLIADEDNPKDGVSGLSTDAQITGTGTLPAAFDTATFSREGTYTFDIAEELSGEAGYDYDDIVYTWTVVVDDVGGELIVTSNTLESSLGTVVTDDVAVFANSYEPTVTTCVSPDIQKTVNGSPATPEHFDFILTADEANPAGGATGFSSDAQITGAGTLPAAFDTATFSREGTYTFYIAEVKGSASGYTYDGTVYTWTVLVEDTGGKLEVTSNTLTDAGGSAKTPGVATFTNTYKGSGGDTPGGNGTDSSTGSHLPNMGDEVPWLPLVLFGFAVFMIALAAHRILEKK